MSNSLILRVQICLNSEVTLFLPLLVYKMYYFVDVADRLDGEMILALSVRVNSQQNNGRLHILKFSRSDHHARKTQPPASSPTYTAASPSLTTESLPPS